MAQWDTESGGNKRRVDQALDILREALVKYPPRPSRHGYGNMDVQRLLQVFVDRFPELTLRGRARTLAFAAKDARNEVAHDIGAMTPHEALRHLANVRQLLKDLDDDKAFRNVDQLYAEHLDTRRGDADNRSRGSVGMIASLGPESMAPVPVRQVGVAIGGKYAPLHQHLLALTDDQWHATFREIEDILGGPLPTSARRHQAWWSNTTSLVSGKPWVAAGWRTRNVRIPDERVSFVRSRGGKGASIRQCRTATRGT